MKKTTTPLDFGGGIDFNVDFVRYDLLISDRGSTYAASAGRVTNRAEIAAFLRRVTSSERFRTATHNSYAVRISHDGALYETKSDDGEVGAGETILRELRRADAKNMCVCVTRWFGGVHLEGDRFAHIQNATRHVLVHSSTD